jgi:DNA polymerase III subunit epsilon
MSADLFKLFGINSIAVLDFETTGLSPENDHPTEVAVYKITIHDFLGVVEQAYNTKIKLPEGVEVPEFITKLNGLTTEELNREGEEKYNVKEMLETLIDDKTLVVAHNANFDLGFLFYHFGIEPAHFMCTRTIEFLTNPHLSCSLKDVHPRYAPESFEQTHRAFDDVGMTLEVFNYQIALHGNEAMMFFKNKMVNLPDREMVYEPRNAIVLDFTKKYARIPREERK